MATVEAPQATAPRQRQLPRLAGRPLELVVFVAVAAACIVVQRGILYAYDGRIMFGVARNLVDHLSLKPGPDPLGQNTPYSSYGIGMSLVLVPLYVVQKLLHLSSPLILTFANVLLVALTASLLARLARALDLSSRVAVFAGLTYGLLTMALQASTELFSEPGVALGAVAALLGVVLWRDGQRRGGWLVGLGLTMALLFRTDSLVLVVVPVLVLLPALVGRGRLRGPSLVGLLVPLVAAVGWTAFYNALRFGSPLKSGYANQTFSAPFWTGLSGFLLHGGKGFFPFNPVLLLALPGLWLLARRERGVAVLMALLAVARPLFYAKWWVWYGGVCWGPRFLLPAAAVLSLPAALCLDRILASRGARFAVAKVVAGALIAASVLVSVLSVAVPYEQRWNEHAGPFSAALRPAGETANWSKPHVHDMLFSLTRGHLGGNLQILRTHDRLPLHWFQNDISITGLTAALVAVAALVLCLAATRRMPGPASAATPEERGRVGSSMPQVDPESGRIPHRA